ncbi:MAG: HEAT repeat domain-containing protein, partial [Sandaracinaceae bacterium]
FRSRRDADPEVFAPRVLLGHVYRAQNRTDEARAAYRSAIAARPADPIPLAALARLERAAGERGAPLQRYYDEAIERTRDRLAAEELIREAASAALEGHLFDAARDYYARLARGGDGSLYVRTEYARALAAMNEHERAEAEYQRAIRSLAGDNRVLPPILLELSRVQLERGEVDESIATLDRALRASGAESGVRTELYDQMRAAYRRADRLDELAERLRHETSRGFEAAVLLGEIEDELGNDEPALEAYRRALRSRSRDIDTRRRVIAVLLRSGRLDEVVAEYRALIRIAPREARFVIELAQLMMQTDRRDEAMRLLADTGRRHPTDATLHGQLAEIYSRLGDDEAANREIALLARIDPTDSAHVIALGTSQYAAGDRDLALATWRRVIEIEGGAEGEALFAGVLADHDLLPEAIAAYQRAVARAPDRLEFVRGLASVLERTGNLGEAEQAWRRVLALGDDDRMVRREARERIVAIWARGGSLETHIRQLSARFSAASGADAETGRFLAEAYRRSGPGRAPLAEDTLRRVVELEPGDSESLLALERIRRQNGNLAGAIEVLGRLVEADPRRAATYLSQMAEHSLTLYRDDDAIRYAARAVELSPDDASAHRRLGDLYRARQDQERAASAYRRALELNDRLFEVYFELAELELARSRTEEADALYRQVLRVTPDDDLVARAARASIQINLGAGSLPTLERDLLPLALSHPERPIFRRLCVELYDAYARPLIVRSQRDDAEATAELQRIGSRAIKPLLEALADPDPSQRSVALDILGYLGNPNAAAPLLALAENTTLAGPERVQALRAAGAVARPTLTRRFAAMAEGTEAGLRGLATWALGRIGGRDAIAVLRRLDASPDPTVRAYAILGLASLDDRSRADSLAQAIATERQVDVLYATVWGLGRIGDPRHVQALQDATAMRGNASSQGGTAAEVAADALGRIGGPAAESALVRELFSPAPEERRAAATALRRALGSDATAPSGPLPPPEPYEPVGLYVYRLAMPRGTAPPIADLAHLEDELVAAARAGLTSSVEEALAALDVLSTLPPRASTGIGMGTLTSDVAAWPDAARAIATASLERIRERLLDALVQLASHDDGAVRAATVELLAGIRTPSAEVAVAAALADAPPSVARAALDVLGHEPHELGPELTERLAELVRRHRLWSIRTRAAQALAGTRTPAAREALREALASDRYAFVREAAAHALSVEPDPADADALARAREHDADRSVREASGAVH